jgi:phytoene dehydrogenase-like protein
MGWRRKEFYFDGAVEWLPGSSPASNLHAILKEVLDFDTLRFLRNDCFVRIEDGSGEYFHVATDTDQLEREMLRIAPEDAAPIREFTDAIRAVAGVSLPVDRAVEVMNVGDFIKTGVTNIPLIRLFFKWKNITIEQYAQRFSNPVLRKIFLHIFTRHEFFSVLAVILSLGWMCMGSGDYPLGGTRAIIGQLESEYRSCGGEIHLNTSVVGIDTGNGSVKGIRCADGAFYGAYAVVSAADLYTTVHTLLDRPKLPRKLEKLFRTGRVFPSLIQVNLGFDRTFPEPLKRCFVLDTGFDYGGNDTLRSMKVIFHGKECGFAPEGKTACVVYLRTWDYRYWNTLRETDSEKYAEKKKRVVDFVIDRLEHHYGRLRESIACIDCATPATFIRYTGIWKGSYQGWAPVPGVIGSQLPKTFPGLSGMYLAGQWVEPAGGLPNCIASGRKVAQIVCHRDRRKFVAK